MAKEGISMEYDIKDINLARKVNKESNGLTAKCRFCG